MEKLVELLVTFVFWCMVLATIGGTGLWAGGLTAYWTEPWLAKRFNEERADEGSIILGTFVAFVWFLAAAISLCVTFGGAGGN